MNPAYNQEFMEVQQMWMKWIEEKSRNTNIS